MKPKAHLTDGAASDLRHISSYTEATWGAAQEEAYLAAIEAALDKLARRPKIGTPRSNFRAGLRSFRVDSHVIFYEEVNDGIAVMRILHTKQDPKLHL